MTFTLTIPVRCGGRPVWRSGRIRKSTPCGYEEARTPVPTPAAIFIDPCPQCGGWMELVSAQQETQP